MTILRCDSGLFRIAMIAIAVLFTWIQAQPQEPRTKPQNSKQSVTADERSTDAAHVDVLPSKNADAKYQHDREEKNLFYDKLIGYATIALATFTFFLFIYTARLWRATVHLGEEAKRTSDRQATEMANSITIAKDAAEAAVVASMPVLSPLIIGGTLHPLSADDDQPVTFDAYVQFVFENFGKTPGIIRELRADLFLNEMDEFPDVEFEKLPPITYEPLVAGESRGEAALMGVAECKKRITLTPTELRELLAEAATGKYRRFALIGQVIYDDFFEERHTRRFCVKMRRMGESALFQLVRGGRAYNHVERKKIPKNDPFA